MTKIDAQVRLIYYVMFKIPIPWKDQEAEMRKKELAKKVERYSSVRDQVIRRALKILHKNSELHGLVYDPKD